MPNTDINLFDMTLETFKKHIDTEPHYQVAMTLWALHTHVYHKFEYTPRLSLQSPTPESGKSEVLKVLRFITPKAKELFSPTPATLFRLTGDTLLIDEADNIYINRDMLGVLNKGHEKGGAVPRVHKNSVIWWPVFGPVAFAGIGTLPATLNSRSIVIKLYRQDPNAGITRLDLNNMEQMQNLAFINELATDWAQNVKLNTDPVMPKGLEGRKGNKWRVLLAIADSLDRGKVAREAINKFDSNDSHVAEFLLHDIRKIFDEKQLKHIVNEELVKELLRLEDFEYDWSNYKGRPITIGLLAMALKPFEITPQRLWLPEGKPRIFQKLLRVYIKSSFENMWRRYKVLPLAGTTGTNGTSLEEPTIHLIKPEPEKKHRRLKGNDM
jgi:hypothetical protein